MSTLPIVAIVGRPNVGKSTLINRFCGGREAIVHDEPGVTRDRLYLPADWNGYYFQIVDTGGLVFEDKEEFLPKIRQQVEVALEEAKAAIFVVDGQLGPTAADYEVAEWLRGRKLPILLAVNKLEESSTALTLASEFWSLGLGEPYAVSAIHGAGTGDLLDALVQNLPLVGEEEAPPELKVAIVGRPNVGKSSLLNVLVGSERSIVSAISGTTRDAIDTVIERDGKRYRFIDTAGIRKRSKVDYGPEAFGVDRALKAIRRADLVLLVIDATEGATEQEQRLAGKIEESGRACVLVVNKWDAVEKDTYTMNIYIEQIREELYFVKWAPTIFTSALTGQRVPQIMEMVDAASVQHQRRISTSVINEAIKEATIRMMPPSDKRGRQGKIYYGTQVRAEPPTFVLFVNEPKLIKDNYRTYLESQFRASLGFEGTPLRFLWRGKTPREVERDERRG